MKIVLGEKSKLGFIEGTCETPSSNAPEYVNWKKVDCMIFSWILNSMSKEIAKSFIYADSAKDLWKEVEDRFGESNAPLIYQIQREISATTQGGMSITQCYTKMKLWDEISCLEPLPACSCGAAKANYAVPYGIK